jgi:hypothetical protein
LSTYDGEWQNGYRHGKGRHTWKDGETYEGSFDNDKRNGIGTYSYITGERFTGYWKNDLREGEGMLYDSKGNVKLKGVWKADRFQRGSNGTKPGSEYQLQDKDVGE